LVVHVSLPDADAEGPTTMGPHAPALAWVIMQPAQAVIASRSDEHADWTADEPKQSS
jgi:hypothetical protein